MPYWSSSKVGADPQGQPSTKQQKKRFKGRKGITMEDLKKQTALRLAQEQQKKGRRHTVDPTPHNIASNLSIGFNPIAHDSYRGCQQGLPSSGSSSPYPNADTSPQPPSPFQYGTENTDVAPAPSRTHPGEPLQAYPPNDYYTTVSASGSINSQSNSKGTSKSKLPHGLTVQELKEMTKARLQAEAVEKEVDDSVTNKVGNEALGPVPTTVRVSHEYRDHMSSRAQSQAPSAVSGFHGVRSPEQSVRSIDAREAWETASVGTSASDFHGSESVYSGINGPDDLPGPAPLARSSSHLSGGGVHDWQHSFHDLPVDSAHNSASVSSPGAYFDGVSYLPNRRRAATLSPRPGGLSYLQEDQQYNGFQMLPGMPTMNSPQPAAANRQRSIPVRTRGAFTHESFKHGPPTYGFFPAGPDLNNSGGNRARTSSTVSLPAISHTAEEFSSVPSTALNVCNTPQRFTNQFGVVREDAPSPSVTGLSSVFREAPKAPSFSNGFDDRIRGSAVSSFDIGSSSTLGLDSAPIRRRAETDIYHNASSAFGNSESFGGAGHFGYSRIRAATWGEPSLDMYDLGLFGEVSQDKQIDDGLADELASILKLSGAEQKDDHLFAPPGF